MKIKSKKTSALDIILKIFLVVLAVIFATPLYITLINIFKSTKEIAASPMSFPLPPIIDNIVQVIKNPNVNLGEMYFNSLCITIFGASICILVSAMAGYYLARMKSKLSQGLYIYFFAWIDGALCNCLRSACFHFQRNWFNRKPAGIDYGICIGKHIVFGIYVSRLY